MEEIVTDIPRVKSRQPLKRVEIRVTGIVQGFAEEGEDEEHAKARLVLEAEMKSNADGATRLHLFVVGSESEAHG